MEIKKETSYIKNVKCSDIYTDSQTDYVLPDYLGDVRKILFTDATLRPSGRFAGGEEVDFSGVVVYNVIYLDSDGEISSAELTSDYDYSVKCSSEGYKDSICDTKISAYSVRLSGPRKICARASLVASVVISEEGHINVDGVEFEGENSPEVSIKTINVRATTPSGLSEREYAEQVLRLDEAIADDVRIIYSNAEAQTESVNYEDDAVNVKGKIRMQVCLQHAEEPAYSVEKFVSFDENLDYECENSGVKLIPHITVTSVKANVNQDDSGCNIVVSTILEFSVIGERNERVEVITDGYLKKYASENSYEDFVYDELVSVETVKGNHNAELERSEIEGENLREVILVKAVPKVERIDYTDDKATLLGEIKYSAIASDVCDDKITYVPIKFSSPFAIDVKIGCQNNPNIKLDVKIFAHSPTASMDANKIYTGCVLDCTVVVGEEKCQRVLSGISARENEKYAALGSSITVYYPHPSETLFSVAKRFHTSSLKIARDNDISDVVFASSNPEGTLLGVKKLIIY